MRIVGARLDALEIPFREPFVSGAARLDRRRLALLTIQTDGGGDGISEWSLRHGLDPALQGRLTDALEGADPVDHRSIESALGGLDLLPQVLLDLRAAVESAMVDLLARIDGRSVASTLAAVPRDDVAVNALLGIDQPDRTAAEARRLVDSGFRCLKLKGGAEPPGALLDRVAAVRSAVGPDVALRLDLNGTLDSSSAASTLRRLAAFDLEYVEDPLAPGSDVAELAKLRRHSPVPIAADESLRDLETARALLDAESVDVLVVKPSQVGGLREARRIIDIAEASGASVTVSTPFETGIGIAAALHLAATVSGDRAHGLATAGLLASDLLARSLAIVSGRMARPTGLGLGVALDLAAVERFRVA